MADVSQLNTEKQSLNFIPNFSSEQLQQIVSALSALNHRPFGNSDNNINVADLFPVSALSINSMSSNPWILESGAIDHIVSKANPWILESGATDHIVSKASVMIESKATTICTVNLPNGGTTHVSHTCNVSFNPNLKLNNVLCVHSFNLNLMFISKLTIDLKCYVTFYPDSCVMQDLATGKMIGSGKQFGGLYHISLSPIKYSANQVSQSSHLWHLRLGHPSPSRFKFLADQLHLNNATLSHDCSICPLAKQTKLSSQKFNNNPFSL